METLDLGGAFWHGRRVFVTGHTGFKGSWLILWLRALGAEVTGYALAPATAPCLYEAARAHEGISSLIGDVRDAAALGSALRDARPEIVFHLAAQSLVSAGYAAPVETYSTNVIGTAQLLEQVRGVQMVRAVVAVTSDKCYDNREREQGYREEEALGGRDPYSSSKAGAELVIAAYRDSFLRARGIALASARAGNAIGGGDWATGRLVPDLLAAFARGEAAILRRPQAIRPWQHVLDPLAGYLTLGRRLLEHGDEYAEAWNFGPREGELVAVAQLAGQVGAAWGNSARTTVSTANTPHEAHTLQLNASKARTRLGWRPRWDFMAAVRATVEWHRAWIAGEDMHTYSLGQIERYSAAA
ncbi:MAG TPA: CDP-glucose 4,6-dehydratase [Burkholderiales bacterium]|nr:CDP-glucose 4,6-dehydratase [Burkholderiales bacterium]